jgi:hypothetical protein
MVRHTFATALLVGFAVGQVKYPFVDPLSDYQEPPNPYNIDGQFIDWSTYKSNGVNLGSWLEKERTHDPIWWDMVGGANSPDEWVSRLNVCIQKLLH